MNMSQYAFKSKYDVVIGGGGIAGVSAAVAASRSGVRVAMVEKGITPGGLAVSGLVNVFLPLCDGNGNQIIFGIAEELLKMSIKYGPGEIPPGWNGDGNEKISRYMLRFSPAALGLALDEFLEENGVDVWYDTVITGTVMNGNAIAALSVHNKSGNGLIEGSSFVDATGDADIANIAGCKLISGVSHLSIWAEQASLKTADASVKYGDRELLHNMVKLGAKDSGEGAFEGEAPRCGISGKIVSEYSIASRRHLREYFKEQLADLGERAAFPIALPAIPQLRTTRRISGRETVWANSANIKIENPAGVVPSWKECGTLWYIPKGALVPDSCENLFAAGRIISAEEGAAWEAVRSIPAVALTGEIAGKMAGERSS
jgi:hypothetical protein